jgi:serine-type D-Ala-D-Ala carboxypeptidase (penicillin-binding protein 5/6)
MMTRDCGRAHVRPFLAYATGVFIGLLLIGAETLTPSFALAKSVTAQSVTVRTVMAPHRFPPWRVAPAHGILLKELKSGHVLYEHDAGKRMSPASLTKIMSALVILERGQLDDFVTISPNAARAHKTHLRVKAGQVFRLEDLLKAMLIVSANDACLAAVEHVGGDEAQFVAHECQGCGARPI